jgi:glycosyltransferase involved in cell wall biosynthesis
MKQLEKDYQEICQRWQKFFLSNSTNAGQDFTAKNFQEVIRLFLNQRKADEKSLVQMFYISTGRLPTKTQIQELKFAQATGSVSAIEDKIKEQYQSIKDRFGKKDIDLTFFPVGTTFIDISHTLSYPFNTGIQRVVRNLGLNLLSDPTVHFIRWDLGIGGWVLVEYETVQNYLPFKKNDFQKDNLGLNYFMRSFRAVKSFSSIAIAAFWHGLFSSYRFLVASEDSSKILETQSFRKLIKLLSKIQNSTKESNLRNIKVVKSPMLINQQIFLVEPTQNIDIVLAHEYFNYIGSLSVLVYDLLPISNPEYFPQTSIKAFPIYLKLLSFADKILTISDFTKDQVIKYCVFKDNVLLETQLLPGQEISIENKNVHNSSDILVLSVGSIEPRKNQISLLQASEILWSKGKKFKLIVVGGQGWKNREILSLKNTLQLRGRDLEFKTDLSDDRLANLFKAANLVVTIPWIEGFGLPLAEALAYEKSVVASDIASHREISNDSQVLWVNPGDIEAIAAAIEKSFSHPLPPNYHYQQNLPASWFEYAQGVKRFLNHS